MFSWQSRARGATPSSGVKLVQVDLYAKYIIMALSLSRCHAVIGFEVCFPIFQFACLVALISGGVPYLR